jgi:hypothetical protein
MKRVGSLTIVALFLFGLTGCLEFLGAAGSGAVVTAEYYFSGCVEKTMCFGYSRTKKALLVALCRMEIVTDRTIEVEGGEDILAKANQMEIKVEIREITPCVTRISVRAGDGFLRWDKATAQEILAQTNKVAEGLPEKTA